MNFVDICFGKFLCFNILVGKRNFFSDADGEENLYQWFPILSQLSKKNDHSIILQKFRLYLFQHVSGELKISWNWFQMIQIQNVLTCNIVKPWIGWNIPKCGKYIGIFKYLNILVTNIYLDIRPYQFFSYEYIQTFVRIKFVCMNIIGHSFIHWVH